MRSYYQYNDRPRMRMRSPWAWTKGVKYLILINVAVFVLQTILSLSSKNAFDAYIKIFALVPNAIIGKLFLWQFVTHIFMHSGILHILFNMFFLWMFGIQVERTLGFKKFIALFLFCGILGGIVQFLFMLFISPQIPTLGASGAVMGVMAAYAVLYPESLLYVFFLFPIKVKYFIWIIAGISFFAALSGGGTIAHMEHLGGLGAGWVYMKYLRNFNITTPRFLHRFFGKFKNRKRKSSASGDFEQEVDDILRKIHREGLGSLTQRERDILDKASRDKKE